MSDVGSSDILTDEVKVPPSGFSYLDKYKYNYAIAMGLPRGTKRYQHNITGEIRYFRNAPDLSRWSKIGTPGSKNWRWIHNATEERFVKRDEPLPSGFTLGRLKT